jgi:hypothetical protein
VKYAEEERHQAKMFLSQTVSQTELMNLTCKKQQWLLTAKKRALEPAQNASNQQRQTKVVI